MGPCNHGEPLWSSMSDWDVLLKMAAICVVDRTGKIDREGMVAADPAAIAAFVKLHAPHVARIGLETGATSTWLWTELNKMGVGTKNLIR
jgi:transposase